MRLESALLKQLRSEAARRSMVECCGLLWARRNGLVQAFTPYPGPLFGEGFRLADDWLFKLYRWGRESHLDLWGFYHSHGGEAPSLLPSLSDQAGHPPGSRCLILASELAPRAFQFYFEKGGFQELRITIE